MDSGKISESVLKRSVLKYVQQNNQSVENACHLIHEAKVGADSSLFAISEDYKTEKETEEARMLTGHTGNSGKPLADQMLGSAAAVAIGRHPMVAVEAIINACNNLICSGLEAFGVQMSLILPEALYESELRHMMEMAREYAEEHQILILGGHTAVSKYVTAPIATVTALGYTTEQEHFCEKSVTDMKQSPSLAEAGTGRKLATGKLTAGMSVVMSKWIGLQGTAKLAREQKETLLKRLPPRFVAGAAAYSRYMSIIPEARIAWREGAAALHDVSGGGIFRALWELAEMAGTGIRVEMKKIPIKQETVEICEVFGLNPYELLSGGALLMVTADGEGLAEKLRGEGIWAAVIGTLTDNNDRVLVTHSEDSEELRFLERPKTDEIDKL